MKGVEYLSFKRKKKYGIRDKWKIICKEWYRLAFNFKPINIAHVVDGT
jgi:hypothetical protein